MRQNLIGNPKMSSLWVMQRVAELKPWVMVWGNPATAAEEDWSKDEPSIIDQW